MPVDDDTVTDISFRYYVPQKPLSDFVALFWYFRGHEVALSRERVLPQAGGELVIRLEKPKPGDSGISGARSASMIIKRTSRDELLGVHFKPGGAFPFLGFPCGELHNIGATLSDIWGESEASRLLCILHDVETVDMKFNVLERWLMQVAPRPLQHHRAVSYALTKFQKSSGFSTTAEMAGSVGLSQRRFIEVFRNEVGLTPKLFCRLQRFQNVIQTIHNRHTPDWVDIALEHGYSDQSHFIHEFHEFSGISPTEYLVARTQHPTHVQV